NALLVDAALGVLARLVERPLERDVVHEAARPGHDHLADLRARIKRLLAKLAEVDRDLAPADHGQALAAQRMVHQGGAQVTRHQVVAWQEDHAEREVRRPLDAEAAPGRLAHEDLARKLGEYAAAVASLGIGIDSATVREV